MKSRTDQTKSSASIKIALLGSFTLDLLPRYLGSELEAAGIHPEFYVGGFGQYQQEILDDSSGYFKFTPDVTILLLDGQDLFKDVYEYPLDYSTDAKGKRVQQRLDTLATLVRKINARMPACMILLNNIIAPPISGLGLLDCNSDYSLKELVRRYNQGIEELARDNPRLYIVDYESLVGRFGYDNWMDERMWYLAKIPLSANALVQLAKFLASYIKALEGLTKKCLVLDLDNTLWGGIVGEDGFAGIQLGQDGIGQAYRDFQKEILNLYKRGIVLAISSKNNYDDAIEVIEKHPNMVLRREHFAVMKVDWRDKATHLREIAEDLNLGLESFVFVDDSPVERSLIMSQLPQVLVVDLPEDPSLYRRTLLNLDAFNMLTLTEEDRKRGKLYRKHAMRESLRRASTSLEEFFESLEMHALIRKADSFAIPRIAQLTQKTNQFNLTTRRYAEADTHVFSNDRKHEVYYLQLLDRFGDNGIVGVAIVEKGMESWKIDTFLLSCRVIGRTVETAFLGYIVEEARKAGVDCILGEYIPTKMNVPVKGFYKQHGFEPIAEADGLWRLDISNQSIPFPQWIKIN